MFTIRFQIHSIQFKKENGFETYFPNHTIFSLIIGFHLGRLLGYIEIFNDARVASLGFFKDNICTTRINKEKKFKIKFQVLQKFAQILPDYLIPRDDACLWTVFNYVNKLSSKCLLVNHLVVNYLHFLWPQVICSLICLFDSHSLA